MSGMLAQVLADSNGFDSLNLADNLLGCVTAYSCRGLALSSSHAS